VCIFILSSPCSCLYAMSISSPSPLRSTVFGNGIQSAAGGVAAQEGHGAGQVLLAVRHHLQGRVQGRRWHLHRRSGATGATYKGFWSMNLKHGDGRKSYANDDHYDDEWSSGLQDGAGRYIWRNGTKYEGGGARGSSTAAAPSPGPTATATTAGGRTSALAGRAPSGGPTAAFTSASGRATAPPALSRRRASTTRRRRRRPRGRATPATSSPRSCRGSWAAGCVSDLAAATGC
jgi:hypothetical protein